MKKRILYLLTTFWTLCFTLSAQDTLRFKTLFWNVENLFDTQHDTLKNDLEFLPQSLRAWSNKRFKKKVDDIARVIVASGEWQIPDLIGLCEVENENALTHLTRYSALKELGYRYVMTNSDDRRGIDVALLYQRDRFKLLQHQSIAIPHHLINRAPTRDILHVTGKLLSQDSLDIFIVHFPSRTGGAKESEAFRLLAASTLRQAIDSLLEIRENPQLLIMGDFNDYPESKSIKQVLNVQLPSQIPESNKLYHLLARKCKTEKEYGSHKYNGEWKLLDHLIVSGNLLDERNSCYTNEKKANLLRLPFLLVEDKKYGGYQPFRTYNGMKYIGGYSDHLPVFIDFNLIVK